jgi:branched-chain amino acid transport system permease protein
MLGGLTTPLVMGILLGGLYGLVALGLSLVFGVMRLINLAHGDFVVLGSYGAYALFTLLGCDPILGLALSLPVAFCLGFLVQKYLMARAREVSPEVPLIIAFGLSLVFQNANQILWTPMSRGLNTAYSGVSFSIGSQQLPLAYLLDFVAGLGVMLALRAFLKSTYLGRAMVAAAQDEKAAQLMGIPTKRVHGYAFAVATALAAVAGVFLGMTFPFTPTSGTGYLAIAFGAVVIGGLGSMAGTFLGGIALGVVQTVGGYLFGSAAQMLFVYGVVLVVLAVRPQGLFGR